MDRKKILIIHGLNSKRKAYQKFIDAMSGEYLCEYFEYLMESTVLEVVEELRRFLLASYTLRWDVVTYSFGAIVLRNYMKRYGIGRFGRVVMVVPPNQGSALLRIVVCHELMKHLYGALARDFVSHESEYLPAFPGGIEVGVIGATKCVPERVYKRLPHTLIEQLFDVSESDGKVKIHEMKIRGMKDWVTVHEYHDEVIDSEEFYGYVKKFLQEGRFQ